MSVIQTGNIQVINLPPGLTLYTSSDLEIDKYILTVIYYQNYFHLMSGDKIKVFLIDTDSELEQKKNQIIAEYNQLHKPVTSSAGPIYSAQNIKYEKIGKKKEYITTINKKALNPLTELAEKITSKIDKSNFIISPPADKTVLTNLYACPVCNANMNKINGKYGLFYSCVNFPTCKGKRNKNGKPSIQSVNLKHQPKIKLKAKKPEKIKETIDFRLENIDDD